MGLVRLNDRGARNATAFGSLNTGSMTFIKKLTSDGSDATLDFVDGTSDVVLDSTYKEYMFICNDIHPETDNTNFTFQGNVAGGSGYNETMTTTFFQALHFEDDSEATVEYEGGGDQAQGTAFQELVRGLGNGNDECCSGYLHLFNPSSTTFVTHFIANFSGYEGRNGAWNSYIAGYFNLTGAIDEIQFKMSADEIQGGTISLYGIK